MSGPIVADAGAPPTAPLETAAPTPAERPGFWQRVVAFAVDYAIVSSVGGLLTLPQSVSFALSNASARGVPRGETLNTLPITLLIALVYFTYLWSGSGGGRTWGMRVMGLRVQREDGSPLDLGRALIRVVGLIASCVVLLIGVIWVAFDPKKQGWHDKFAGSVVVPDVAASYPSHPVTLEIAPPLSPRRFWAFPVLGLVVKAIALIPVLIMFVFAWIAVIAVFLVVWIPVLIVGRYPAWAHTFMAGMIRWSTQATAFLYGLTERYPWPGAGPDHPVKVHIEPATTSLRPWAIPLALIVKLVVVIPAYVLLSAASQGFSLAFILILWAPVLFTGSYPAWGYRLGTTLLRWNARTSAFVVGLTDMYPRVWNWEQ